jgi:hypothetical protein
LEAYPEMKDAVLDTIYLFADASEGTSNMEEAAIAQLIERLKLEE